MKTLVSVLLLILIDSTLSSSQLQKNPSRIQVKESERSRNRIADETILNVQQRDKRRSVLLQKQVNEQIQQKQVYLNQKLQQNHFQKQSENHRQHNSRSFESSVEIRAQPQQYKQDNNNKKSNNQPKNQKVQTSNQIKNFQNIQKQNIQSTKQHQNNQNTNNDEQILYMFFLQILIPFILVFLFCLCCAKLVMRCKRSQNNPTPVNVANSQIGYMDQSKIMNQIHYHQQETRRLNQLLASQYYDNSIRSRTQKQHFSRYRQPNLQRPLVANSQDVSWNRRNVYQGNNQIQRKAFEINRIN